MCISWKAQEVDGRSLWAWIECLCLGLHRKPRKLFQNYERILGPGLSMTEFRVANPKSDSFVSPVSRHSLITFNARRSSLSTPVSVINLSLSLWNSKKFKRRDTVCLNSQIDLVFDLLGLDQLSPQNSTDLPIQWMKPMKLQINKACDLSSISVFPPNARSNFPSRLAPSGSLSICWKCLE